DAVPPEEHGRKADPGRGAERRSLLDELQRNAELHGKEVKHAGEEDAGGFGHGQLAPPSGAVHLRRPVREMAIGAWRARVAGPFAKADSPADSTSGERPLVYVDALRMETPMGPATANSR